MVRGAEKARRWRIGIRGILYFTTAIGVSFALLRFGFDQSPMQPELWPPRAQLAVLFIGMFSCGGAVGALIGRMGSGTANGGHVGFWVGGMAGLYVLWKILP